MRVCMYARMYVYICACKYEYECIYMNVGMYVSVYVIMYVRMYECMYVCMYIYICM